MFSNTEVERILILQNKSYELFIWIVESLKWGKLQFTEKHVNSSAQDIMRKWISRNLASLPASVNVQEINDSDLPAFLNMSLSFPVVSFEAVKGGELIAGCECGFCAVYARNHYVPKKLKAKDIERADRAIQMVYQTIGEELGLSLDSKQVSQFQKKYPELKKGAMIIAYVQDLDRRTRFEVQNSTGLVLWRRLKRKTKIRGHQREALLRRRQLKSSKFKISAEDYEISYHDLKIKMRDFFSEKSLS